MINKRGAMPAVVKKTHDRLGELSDLAFQFAIAFKELGGENKLAYDYFARCVSCLMASRSLLFAHYWAASDHLFVEAYINTNIPESIEPKNIEVVKLFVKASHTQVRFALFQGFYSQTEFTYRIIQRNLFPKDLTKKNKRNPFTMIIEEYGFFDTRFVKFLNSMRNTIHNNGWYFPDWSQDDFLYEFKGKNFNFYYGKPFMEVNILDIIDIIEFVLLENSKLFENTNLALMDLPKDKH